MADLVYMKHAKNSTEDSPPAITTAEAFDELWSDKGWVLCDQTGKKVTTAEKATAGGSQ